MKQRSIAGHSVGALGLGCMGMSWLYGAADREESLLTLDRAIGLGVNFWDTADVYGAGENEVLLGESMAKRRDEVFLCTKFGNVFDRSMTAHQDLVDADQQWIVDGTPDYVRACAEASLKRLGIDTIDLYYQHRVDPRVPIEDTVGAMAELVAEGKVRYLGLSEASVETIQRAVTVHPIAAVQSEYSLWTRDYEDSVIPLCRDRRITFVPYSPLGRGFLTGTITNLDNLDPDDYRRVSPRFQPEAMEHNMALADMVKAIAAKRNCTPAQVALAWLLAQDETLIPIPGTKRRTYLEDNVEATEVALSVDDFDELANFQTSGPRYAPMGMQYING